MRMVPGNVALVRAACPGVIFALVALAFLLAGPAPAANAAAPTATTEVTQTPPGGSAVALGTTVTYTVVVTLSAGQAQSMTIHMTGDANIINRNLVCTSITNGAADVVAAGGGPSCMWNAPGADTYTFTFTGTTNGFVSNLLPGSVVCTDNNSTNTCNDEPVADRLPLSDSNGDVGAIIPLAPPVGTSEVDQVPPANSTVAVGTRVTYTVRVTLTAAQAAPLTIQLAGDPVLVNRDLSCTSTTNGAADQVDPAGAPTCMWSGPLVPGIFTFIFEATVTAMVSDAVPAAGSVVCSDLNSSNGCDDETAANQVALADTNADVGPLDIIAAPTLTGEVDQSPDGGTSISNGTTVTYTVTVNLTVAQTHALTIQLAGDADVGNRTLTCTSTTNGNADAVDPAGAPSCMWQGPLAVGRFTFTLTGTATGPVGDAVPHVQSLACKDINASNTCDAADGAFYHVALGDSDGDVGALVFVTSFRVTLPMVARD